MGQTGSCEKKDLVDSKWRYLLWGLPVAGLLVSAITSGLVQAILWPSAFTLMGGACLANAKGCGRTHCHVTGPLYLIAGILSALTGLGWSPLSYGWIAAGTLLGTTLAYTWEWSRGKYLREASSRAGD